MHARQFVKLFSFLIIFLVINQLNNKIIKGARRGLSVSVPIGMCQCVCVTLTGHSLADTCCYCRKKHKLLFFFLLFTISSADAGMCGVGAGNIQYNMKKKHKEINNNVQVAFWFAHS